MHLHHELNVLPTKKEAPSKGTMAIPASEATLVAALRLLRALLLVERHLRRSTGKAAAPGIGSLLRSARRERRRIRHDCRDGERHAIFVPGKEIIRRRCLLSDGPLLRRQPVVDVLLRNGLRRQRASGSGSGPTPSATPSPDVRGRRDRAEGVPRIPGQGSGPAAIRDAAGECCPRKDDGCPAAAALCVDTAPGGRELDGGSARDRVSNVALGRPESTQGRAETHPELSERPGPRVHVLQSEPLVPGASTR